MYSVFNDNKDNKILKRLLDEVVLIERKDLYMQY